MLQPILRFYYRLVAPRHPRGWLDFHSVDENGKAWIHCHGMEKWNLPNIEFIDVPTELGGYAHGISMGILYYLKNIKVIQSGEYFGGALVSENQIVHHLATLHEIKREDDSLHNKVLRVVDYKSDLNSGFPFRLFATHLISIAEISRNPNQIKNLYLKSIEIYPGDKVAKLDDVENPYEKGSNLNNFASYLGLGDLNIELGLENDGFNFIEKAITKCPSWALQFSNDLKSQFGENLPDKAKNDPRFKFWRDLDKDAIIGLIKKYGG